MSEKDKSAAADSDPGLEWAKLWQTMAESSNRMVEAWSGSMAPFMLARLSEKPAGFGDGNELSAAIERMAQGRGLPMSGTSTGKWRWPLAPGSRCASGWRATMRSPPRHGRRRRSGFSRQCPRPVRARPTPDWREAFAKWSEISNEELIRNQRTDGFLQAQKELLQAGLQLRSRQDDVAEAASAMFGLPTRRDFDDVTRQLTELRREVRTLARQVRDRKSEGAL